MNQNPYSEPTSEVAPPVQQGPLEVGQPQSRPIGHGWRWFADAWELFKPAWGMWLLTMLLLILIMIGLQLVPFLGGLAAQLIAPVLVAGILHMSRQADLGQGVEIGELFAGFRERTGSLIAIGALNLVVSLLIVGMMIAPMMGAMTDMGLGEMQGMNDEQLGRAMLEQGSMGAGSVLFVLLGLALMIPWLAAYWFAVPLIFLGQRSVGAALKESFLACFRNILPFLWYGIIGFFLSILAVLPMGLGWLVLLPVLMLTFYTSFRDIFVDTDR